MPKLSNIEMLKQLEQPIVYIRKKTDIAGMPAVIGSSFMEIGAYLKELDEMLTDLPFVAYPNFEMMDENNIDVMIGFHVSKLLPEKKDIKVMMLPERKIIFSMYRGKYEDMAPLYLEMAQWMKENGYEGTGTSYEYYYNGPDTPEEDLLTRIIMPLK